MRKEEMNERRLSPDEAMAEFVSYVEDPRLMDDEEVSTFLAEAGFDFATFDARLSADIDLAKKQARLAEARESRGNFLKRAQRAAEDVVLSLDEKRAEIQQRLGLLGGQSAAVFNRNYQDAEDEEDIDDLLESLRALDERADGNVDER
ncbi:MAG: hypothetical protein ACO1SV_10505 [Fimbriimonas sp.]